MLRATGGGGPYRVRLEFKARPSPCDGVTEAAFGRYGLPAVAGAGHWLPVRSVPEQPHIALVSGSVINHLGRIAAATSAEPVAGQGKERFALTLPLAVIATGAGRRPPCF